MEIPDNHKISIFYYREIVKYENTKQDFLNYISEDNKETIIVDNTDDAMAYLQHEVDFWKQVEHGIGISPKKIIFLNNGKQHNRFGFEKFSYDYFPLSHLYGTYRTITTHGKNLSKEIIKDNKIPFSYFIKFLNNQPHDIRCYMVDNLAKSNLIDSDNTLFTWNQKSDILYGQSKSPYNFVNWKEKEITYDGLDKWNKQYVSEKIDKEKFFIELVGETPVKTIGFTEKTWKPILNGDIFLLYGVKNQNQRLKKYGFLLYDNLFDYNFDNMEQEDAVKEIIKQLNKLRYSDYENLYEKTIHRLNHNLSTALDIINECRYIPSYLNNKNIKIHSLSYSLSQIFNQ